MQIWRITWRQSSLKILKLSVWRIPFELEVTKDNLWRTKNADKLSKDFRNIYYSINNGPNFYKSVPKSYSEEFQVNDIDSMYFNRFLDTQGSPNFPNTKISENVDYGEQSKQDLCYGVPYWMEVLTCRSW